jgi:hypothetical protein
VDNDDAEGAVVDFVGRNAEYIKFWLKKIKEIFKLFLLINSINRIFNLLFFIVE